MTRTMTRRGRAGIADVEADEGVAVAEKRRTTALHGTVLGSELVTTASGAARLGKEQRRRAERGDAARRRWWTRRGAMEEEGEARAVVSNDRRGAAVEKRRGCCDLEAGSAEAWRCGTASQRLG